MASSDAQVYIPKDKHRLVTENAEMKRNPRSARSVVPLRRGSANKSSMRSLASSSSMTSMAESFDDAGEAEFWDECEHYSNTGCEEEESVAKLRLNLKNISDQLKSAESKHDRFVANHNSEIEYHLQTIHHLEAIHNDRIESLTKDNDEKSRKLDSECALHAEVENKYQVLKLQYDLLVENKDTEISRVQSSYEAQTLELQAKLEKRESERQADLSELQKEHDLLMMRMKHDMEIEIHELKIKSERHKKELQREHTEFQNVYSELENTRSALDTLEGYVKDIIFPCDSHALLDSYRLRGNGNFNPLTGFISQFFSNLVLAVKKSLSHQD